MVSLRIFEACLICIIWMSLVTCTNQPPPAKVDFRILETTDLHCMLLDYDYSKDKADPSIGLVRTATLIRQAREEMANCLLVDNGDLLQGSALGDYMARNRLVPQGDIHPMIKAMNELGYDAANVGNHDLNYGLEFLESCISGANFPFICANLFKDTGEKKDPYFSPTTIITKEVIDESGQTHPLRLGLIGLLPPQVMRWDRNHLEGKVIVKDMLEVARELVPKLRRKADLVIILAHSGLHMEQREGMDENAVLYLSQVEGVDAIVFGHVHDFFPGPGFSQLEDSGVDNQAGRINGVPAVMAGMYASHLGVIDLKLKLADGLWSVQNARSFLRPIANKTEDSWVAAVVPDKKISQMAESHHLSVLEWIAQPLGETPTALTTFFSLVGDSPAIQLIADAQLWHGESVVRDTVFQDLPILSAAAPFKAGARRADQYTNIPPGPIAYHHVSDLYVYPNTISIVKVNGAEIRDWLDMSAGVFSTIDPKKKEKQSLINRQFPTFNFDVLKGVTYEIDVTQPPKYDHEGKVIHSDSSRIRHLAFQGQPISEEQSFLVVTNNYRAHGGGNFPHLGSDRVVLEASLEVRKIIVEFIRKHPKMIGRKTNNWRLSPCPASVELAFFSSTSLDAQAAAQQCPGIRFTGETNANGFGIYLIGF